MENTEERLDAGTAQPEQVATVVQAAGDAQPVETTGNAYDGGNDLAMLARFEHAYATRGASAEAKRAAGNVIGSCALHAVPRHIVATIRREGPLR